MMKEIFFVTKYIGQKRMFLQKVKEAFVWKDEPENATAFTDFKDAQKAFDCIPDGVIGNFFQIERCYKKKKSPIII